MALEEQGIKYFTKSEVYTNVQSTARGEEKSERLKIVVFTKRIAM